MILDTNIVIYACQADGDWLAPWTNHPDAAIASVTQIEALGFAGISPEEEAAILNFIDSSPTYPLDDEVIEQAIQCTRDDADPAAFAHRTHSALSTHGNLAGQLIHIVKPSA